MAETEDSDEYVPLWEVLVSAREKDLQHCFACVARGAQTVPVGEFAVMCDQMEGKHDIDGMGFATWCHEEHGAVDSINCKAFGRYVATHVADGAENGKYDLLEEKDIILGALRMFIIALKQFEDISRPEPMGVVLLSKFGDEANIAVKRRNKDSLTRVSTCSGCMLCRVM
uniref:Uncharacterized protein n=1 Tax=Lotharella oceanica TaxID=641309 RepID=A0A7S2TTK9_9EUKA|mmetsp:Transcript_29364/g.54977  ORF Transcript_29364/g.54977 Transcript_29364/m.54977 type:complete len:170 (+) Transcript_29364:65-574(+)